MALPTCRWSVETVKINKQIKFIINTGGLSVSVAGTDREPVEYTQEQGPDIIILRKFSQAGSYTWTVTNAEGSCSGTVEVVGE